MGADGALGGDAPNPGERLKPLTGAGALGERASSVISGTAASAFETGQPTFAPSAASTNAGLVDAGHGAATESAIFVIPAPGTKVTVADVSSCSAGVPAFASPSESAIEKQAEWAAAISSSGLVLPFGLLRARGPTDVEGPKAPLPASWIVPEPSINVPRQVVLIVRSVAISAPPVVVDGRG